MSEEPPTFEGSIEKFKSWSKVRLNEPDARLLITSYLFLRDNPDQGLGLRTLWHNFHNVTLLEVVERLDKMDWANTDGRVLTQLLTATIEIRKGMNNFLPSTVSGAFMQEHKDILWIWHLLTTGVRLQPRDPYCLLQHWAVLFIGGAYALVENTRRAHKYPITFVTGLMGYLLKSSEGNTPESQKIIIAARRLIAAAARNHMKKERIPPPEPDDGETSVEEEIEETLLKDFFHGSAEATYARALNGLRVAPHVAVVRDIIDKRSDQSKFERVIKSEEKAKIDGFLNTFRSAASAEEEFRRSELTEKFKAKYPKDWALIDAIAGQDKSPEDLSKTDPRSPEAIQKAYERASKKLKEFLS